MTPKRFGFNKDLATRYSRANVKDRRRAFSSSLTKLKERVELEFDVMSAENGESSDSSEEDEETSFMPIKYSRRVSLLTHGRLRPHKILLANRLYNNESKMLEELQQDPFSEEFLRDEFFSDGEDAFKPASGDYKNAQFLGMYKKVRRDTEISVNFANLGGFRGERPIEREFDLDSQALLLEFFEICQRPNPGEMLMLAIVSRRPFRSVWNWFITKQQRSAESYVARKLAHNKDN